MDDSGGGGRTRLLLALVILPLTPFLLLIETPPMFGRSLRFPPIYLIEKIVCFPYPLSVSPFVAAVYLLGYTGGHFCAQQSWLAGLITCGTSNIFGIPLVFWNVLAKYLPVAHGIVPHVGQIDHDLDQIAYDLDPNLPL